MITNCTFHLLAWKLSEYWYISDNPNLCTNNTWIPKPILVFHFDCILKSPILLIRLRRAVWAFQLYTEQFSLGAKCFFSQPLNLKVSTVKSKTYLIFQRSNQTVTISTEHESQIARSRLNTCSFSTDAYLPRSWRRAGPRAAARSPPRARAAAARAARPAAR